MASSDDEERRLWFRREVLPLEPQLCAYARRFCRNGQADPEDLVHEAFARIIGYAEWRRIENVSAFAMRTLRNSAIDAARRRDVVSIEVIADLDKLSAHDEEPGPEAVVVARDELRRLTEIVANLPDQCRRVFTLRKAYGLSHAEIAVRLGISVSTVEKHLVKGLRLCSDAFGRGDATPAAGETRSEWSTARRRRR